MAKVIIFGLLDLAELAHFYLTHDSSHEVVAFSVSKEYLPPSKRFCGLPVVDFADIEKLYPASEYNFFAPLSYRQMNRLRASVYDQIKQKGYSFISYVSSKATVYPNTRIGDNCFIFEDNTIQPFTNIGNNVILWSGNHVGHHSTIGDHVFFSSHVVLSGHCRVGDYCFFGVNSAVRNHLEIAEGTCVAMGACVTRDTEPWGIYKGSPAVRSGVSSRELDNI